MQPPAGYLAASHRLVISSSHNLANLTVGAEGLEFVRVGRKGLIGPSQGWPGGQGNEVCFGLGQRHVAHGLLTDHRMVDYLFSSHDATAKSFRRC